MQGITWKTLKHSDRTIPVPFKLIVTDHDNPIICEEVVRIVPAKRLVAFGFWGEQEVAIKLFYDRVSASRDCQRDAFGVETLMQSNVPTPKLLFKGSAEKNHIHILIYQKINAKSLEARWHEKNNIEELVPLLHAVTIEIATQHVLGILQPDMHLKNFLVTENCIYTLDGGKISRFDFPLDKKTSMEYLALFFVQLGIGITDLQQELFRLYTKSRGWLVKPTDVKEFKKMIDHHTQDRWRRYQKKIFRTCTAFKRINKINKIMMYDRKHESPEFMRFLNNPESFFNSPTTVILKAGNTATVAKIYIDNKAFVAKRYNIKSLGHWLRRCLRSSRAAKSWRIAQQMYVSYIKTAKPIAFVENHVLGLRGKSYFLMEYLEGSNLGDYFSIYDENDEQYKEIAKQVLVLICSLTELRMTHGDLKMTNILIENDKPYLIDLDGVSEHHTSLSLRHSFKSELKRFMQNWQNQPQIHSLFSNLIDETKLNNGKKVQ